MSDRTAPLVTTGPIPAILVSASAYLRTGERVGGVQICTREYLDTLEAAGFSLKVVDYGPARRWSARLRRVLWPRPYSGFLPPDLEDRIVQSVSDGVGHVFLNQVDLAPLAAGLRARLAGRARIVLLSHGLESVDFLHFLRARSLGDAFRGVGPRDLKNLARKLVAECTHRLHLDHVFCLSPFEAEIERWLGARRVDWLPRTVPVDGVDWKPQGRRVGYVGTLNHPPNTEGLVLFLRALAPVRPGELRVRLVGSPQKEAEGIASQFPFVDYLGPLSDDELREEAGSWNCFAHPLFCYARGCSTKLAVALAWGIPVATTPAGCRGYTWREGRLPLADTPEELAGLAVSLLDSKTAEAARQEVRRVVESSPTLDEVASIVRRGLLGAPGKDER